MPVELNITSLDQNREPDTTLSPFFEATSEIFVVPASGSSATILVGDSTRYSIGVYVWISGAGWFEITGLADATHLYVRNNGTTGNEVPGTAAVIGSAIVTSPPPTAGATGAMALYDTLAQTFTVPSGATPAYMYLITGGWPVVNMYIYVEGAGWFKVTEYSASTNRCTVINADDQNIGSGNTAAIGAAVYPCPPNTMPLGGTYLERTVSAALFGVQLDGKDVIPLSVTSGIKIARGQHTTVAASTDVETGLSTVVAVVASFEGDPALTELFVSAEIGDQAGTPAAGYVTINTWKPTATGDVTPIASTVWGLKVNWIAIGT